MDQEALAKSLEKLLDQAETMLNTFVVIALLAYFAGIQGADPIKAVGFEIPRKTGFTVLGSVFIFANMVMLIIFLRVGDVINGIEPARLRPALTSLGTHKWLFNPFSYFGPGITARAHASAGFGLCIIIWWIGFAALDALRANHSMLGTTLNGIYLVVGLSSMLAVNRVYGIVRSRCKEAHLDDLLADLESTTIPRAMFTFLGIGLGVLASLLTGALTRSF
jgi:hypothetical protein